MSASSNKISVYVSRGNCLSPMGIDVTENMNGLIQGEIGISKIVDQKLQEDSFYGAIVDKNRLHTSFQELNYVGEYSDLEKMMLITVDKIKSEFKVLFKDDCGLIISTTKGNIDELSSEVDEENYALYGLANKIKNTIGIATEPIVLSNACVSGVMAISVAKRLIQSGSYKHFVIIGADVFSKFVFSGFQSFQAISNQPCKPYDKSRDGITLGEAAAAIFVTKNKSLIDNQPFYELIGDSSINDANHISGPSRTGEGLFKSISNAIKEAETDKIDMISSHGTATNYNDEMEAQAFNRASLQDVPLFSLKSCFGHTLGAAGLLETVIALNFSTRNMIPPSIGYEEHGVTLPLNVSKSFQQKEINVILKTASGFGGSNTAVLFRKGKSNEK
ncbi:beta-ketoacyl synthase [Brumimicrobium aurantiacum]|uniref:Nodulation protein E n=2 Tax=Brumimicrobium aurantiacum TaxID=1737063 RepID=A0A3E1EZK6_9FLAO|nr:beta-ketoacyl synthase [Brumimicrobium aurantiacum]